MAEVSLGVLELCRLVARAEMSPFSPNDYHAYSGVRPEGPHEIGSFTDDGVEYEIVRDGNIVGIYRSMAGDPAYLQAWHLTEESVI